jgi:hypothetical protein
MSAAKRKHGPVPAEYRGLARQLISRVHQVDQVALRVVKSITAPLQARLNRHPVLRAEQTSGTEWAWRGQVPAEFRVGPVRIQRRGRHELRITETRICAQLLRRVDWDEAERGLGIVEIGVHVSDGTLRGISELRASISLHAIARRFERGPRDEAGVLDDIAVLADVTGTADRIETEHGRWLGKSIETQSAGGRFSMYTARTWIGPNCASILDTGS